MFLKNARIEAQVSQAKLRPSVKNAYQTMRAFYWKLRYYLIPFPIRHFLIRVLHLIYLFKNKEFLNRFRLKCYRQDLLAQDRSLIMNFEIKRSMGKLLSEMLHHRKSPPILKLKDFRQFRGKFISIVRNHRKLSHKELCRILNSHPDICNLDARHSCFHSFYPFTPKFLITLEEHTDKIIEEVKTGFLFGIGFPTEEFTQFVAKACLMDVQFKEFNELYYNAQGSRDFFLK